MVIVLKSDGQCGANDSKIANCVVLIDVNGIQKPNRLGVFQVNNPRILNDQFKLIIKKDSVVPAEK